MPEALEENLVMGEEGVYVHKFRMEKVHSFQNGSAFGDVALNARRKLRTARVVAVTDCHVAVL